MKAFIALLAGWLGWTGISVVRQDRIALVSTSRLDSLESRSCVSYHGRLVEHDLHVVLFSHACRDLVDDIEPLTLPTDLASGFVVQAMPSRLDASVRKSTASEAFSSASGDQHILSIERQPSLQPTLLAALPRGDRLLHFPSSQSLAAFTSDPANAYVELVAVSSGRMMYPAPRDVPAEHVARVTDAIARLKFNSLVHTLIGKLSTAELKRDVRYLTGEDQASAKSDKERWHSRHSMSTGGHAASNWLLKRFSAMPGLDCKQHKYQNGFAPLVACEVLASGTKSKDVVVLAAHFDSRGSFGYLAAPGGDDDGSGTALILSVADLITSHHLTFGKRLVIAAFSGEEQGLLSSQWYAKHLKEEKKEDVSLMIQVDMIGYRKPGEPLQLAFPPDSLGLQEARWLVGNVSTIYVPELVTGLTTACCSDHQSFTAQGYAATWVFERNGPIADPFYHNSGDVSNRLGYDFDQIHAISKVVLATVLEFAGFAFP